MLADSNAGWWKVWKWGGAGGNKGVGAGAVAGGEAGEREKGLGRTKKDYGALDKEGGGSGRNSRNPSRSVTPIEVSTLPHRSTSL